MVRLLKNKYTYVLALMLMLPLMLIYKLGNGYKLEFSYLLIFVYWLMTYVYLNIMCVIISKLMGVIENE